jgi:hypothetical protein
MPIDVVQLNTQEINWLLDELRIWLDQHISRITRHLMRPNPEDGTWSA